VTTAIDPGAVVCPCVGSATAFCVAPSTSGGNIWKPIKQALHYNLGHVQYDRLTTSRTALSRMIPILRPGRPNTFAERSRTIALSYSQQGNIDISTRTAYQADVLQAQICLNKLVFHTVVAQLLRNILSNAHRSPPLVSTLRHINPIHIPTSFFKISFNNISVPALGSFPSGFPTKLYIYFLYLARVY
jgi:hypothetical protein